MKNCTPTVYLKNTHFLYRNLRNTRREKFLNYRKIKIVYLKFSFFKKYF